MCTALTLTSGDKLEFFGRNMDIGGGFNPTPTITPRGYSIKNTATGQDLTNKYAMIGMAMVINGIPFYGDMMNEAGLGVAGLAFNTAKLNGLTVQGANNIPEYLFQPWVCANFATVDEVLPELKKLNLMSTPPFEGMPPTPMHWMIHDKTGKSVAVECGSDGLRLFEYTAGVMTNYPPYDWHLRNLSNYMNVTNANLDPVTWNGYEILPLSNGLGSCGLPGGTGAADRFVRVAWLKQVVEHTPDENSTVTSFYHILQNVAKPKGSSDMGNGETEYTYYTSCMCLNNGHLYYNNYTNNQISLVELNAPENDLDGKELIIYEYEDKFVPVKNKLKA